MKEQLFIFLMELQFPSFQSVVTFLFFIFIVLKLAKRLKFNDSAKNLPPGPWKLPLIGNMHQLISSLPHHAFRDMASKYGPLMHLQLGEVSTIVVSSPEVAKEIFRTHDIIFADRPDVLASRILFYDNTDIVFSPYGGYWRQLRKICMKELLSTKGVQSFRSIREEEVFNLVNEISGKSRAPINLSEKISSLTYCITARAAFGPQSKYQAAFISAVDEIVKLLEGFSVSDLYPSIKLLPLITGMRSKLWKVHQKTDRILEDIVEEHKQRRTKRKTEGDGEVGEDLVDALLKLQENGNLEFALTKKTIKAVILDILSGGSASSSTVLVWAMSEMLKNPRVMKKAQTEVRQVFDGKGQIDEACFDGLVFLKLVIKETLRLHPPAPLLAPRVSGQRCEINGYEIPMNTRLIVNAWAICRDPRHWTEPDKFHPERFLDSSIDFKGKNFDFIPFGAGRRICLGITFALANIELTLAHLLYHFDWELPGGIKPQDLDMTERFGMSVGRMKDLYATPIPYHPMAVG